MMNMLNVKLITGTDQEAPANIFKAFVGQEAAVKKLQFFLSSQGTPTVFPTLLFTGSHGLGKTYLAQKLASNMHRRFIEINAATLESGNDFLNKILMERVMGDTPATILIDEAHALHSEVTDILLTLLSPNDSGKNHIRSGHYTLEYDMAKVNLILATTDAFCLFNALVNRTERIYFEPYKPQELLDMLRLYLPDIVLECNVKELADACRGRGRDAYRLAQHVARYCHMQGTKVFSHKGWAELKGIMEICPLGLNKQEVALLGLIGANEPIAASNLAAFLMIGEAAMTAELEPRLRELNLISTSSKGRLLTAQGKQYWQAHYSISGKVMNYR